MHLVDKDSSRAKRIDGCLFPLITIDWLRYSNVTNTDVLFSGAAQEQVDN